MKPDLWWGHCHKPIPLSALGVDPARLDTESHLLVSNLRPERKRAVGSKVSLGVMLDRLLPPEPGKRKRAKEQLVIAVAATVLTARLVAEGLSVSRSWVLECQKKYRASLPALIEELQRASGDPSERESASD